MSKKVISKVPTGSRPVSPACVPCSATGPSQQPPALRTALPQWLAPRPTAAADPPGFASVAWVRPRVPSYNDGPCCPVKA
ncbi:hypothetical protein FKP32DRAFT_1118277 [Trametes sanguinea]|nr:hypothetical protein FKP32DRAFT_1118277 [Trametes sanguinea]